MKKRNIIILILLLGILLFLPKRLKSLVSKSGQDPNNLPGVNEDEVNHEPEDNDKDDFPIFKYTSSSLRLRKGPSTDDEIILTMPELAQVEVLESQDGWDKIVYHGDTGYASSEFLSLEKIEKEDPNPDPNQEPVIGLKIIKGVLLVNKKYGMPANHFKGVDPEAKGYLDKMMADIKNQTGLGLTIRSGHRTYELQDKFFTNNSRVNGLDHALKYSAKPGHSEHETGLAFDLCDTSGKHCLLESFENITEGIWLRENAHKYGFILRYPKGKEDITGYAYEPWHFRYVGLDHAEIIYERDITLEEYLLNDE